jgi:hypothetical protein
MENTLNGKKVLKLSISQLSLEQQRKFLDPLFLPYMGLVKPKNHLTLLSL